ncbi:MAG: hypothetical protein RLW62_13050 [Gammaproteobacteria bacterium]
MPLLTHGQVPPTPRPAARAWRRHLPALAVALLLVGPAAPASAGEAYPPGQYELAWQTVMPHLEEMRRATEVATRCLDGAPDALFPVLRQPALRGCTLQPVVDGRWRLTCRSDAVASGNASLHASGKVVSGDLAIKMGGKNMTFSQHVTATWRGSCQQH